MFLCGFFSQGRGKTTLLAALKGHKLPLNLSTVGIVIDEWQVQASSSSRFTLQRFLNQVRQRRQVLKLIELVWKEIVGSYSGRSNTQGLE